MGCMCNKNKKPNEEPIKELAKPDIVDNTQENIINNKKSQENINNLNKNFKKENFADMCNFLSNNWNFIVIIILIIIGLLYYLYLRPNII